jgi:hypothetical protein
MRLLKILASILGYGMFIPVSCFAIIFALHDLPLEKVDPGSRFYPLFFKVATLSDGSVNYVMLAELAKFKSENPIFSFILPKTYSPCDPFICYRVISDNGTEQIIEIEENPDSLFAFKVWSRYRATHSEFTPISLMKVSVNIVFYSFACSLVLYAIGRMLRKKIMIITAQQAAQSDAR